MRARIVSALVLAALVGGAVWAGMRLRVETDITHFLPQGDDPRVARVARGVTRSELSRTVTLTVRADDVDVAARAARLLGERLARRREVAWVRTGPDESLQRAFYEAYYPRRLGLAVDDPAEAGAFLSDASPWLDATALWGAATVELLDAVQARLDGDVATSDLLAASAEETAAEAAAVVVDPADNSWGKARVRIADGVLDVFHYRIGFALAMWEAGDVVNVAPAGTATASSVEVPQFGVLNVNDDNPSTRWASGYDDNSWVQVKLAEPTVVRGITINWEAACANAYELQTSNDGTTWTTLRTVNDSTCGLDLFTFDEGDPVQYVRMQGIDRKTTWGYSIWEFGIYAAG